jgi:hypothetical protein
MINGRQLSFSRKQLQHAFKHARCFGVIGPANNLTLEAFRLALLRHVKSPDTQLIQGSFRGFAVTHLLNVNNGLNVMRDLAGNFLSVWVLNPVQMMHVVNSGKLGGSI